MPIAANVACSSDRYGGAKDLGLESGSLPEAPLIFDHPLPVPEGPEPAETGPFRSANSSEDFADLVDYPRNSSIYCGDGAYDPEIEECDDGVSSAFDVCSNDCQTRDVLAAAPVEAGRLLKRGLGTSPHVSSGLDWGGALSWIDTSAEPQLIVQARDVYGNRIDEFVVAGIGSNFSERQVITQGNPAIATLPGGMHVVAFNELNGDGSELGVGISVLRASGAGREFEIQDAGFANTITQGAQFDADLVWTGKGLIAAWVDTSDAEHGPDAVFREFDQSLGSKGVERALADSDLPEGPIALCAARSSSSSQDWAAVWRRGLADGAEAIVARLDGQVISFRPTLSGATPSYVSENIEPEPGEGLMPGHADDRPAIASIGEDLVLVAFTVGTDPENTGVANVFRLWAAVLDFEENEVSWIGPVLPLHAGSPDTSHDQRQPVLSGASFPTQPGTIASAYLAWRSEGKLGESSGEEVWLKRLDWNAVEDELNVSIEEVELPRAPEHQVGDQRRPTLATIAVPGGHALSMAWEDWGRAYDKGDLEQARPDVVVQVAPIPLRRAHDKIKDCESVPCGLGEGPCERSEDCQGGLICAANRGPWHGYGPMTAVCEPAHCTNEVTDGGESGEDCGGECGPCFSCLGKTSSLGTAHFCSAVCRCENLEGDCDTDLDCQEGLACFTDQGNLVGYPEGIDLCLFADCQNGELDSGEERVDCGGTQCVECAPGLPSYCSAETVCDEVGLGSCESDADCGITSQETQLYCGLDQGVYYGYPAGTGACVPEECLSGRNQVGRLGACSSACPCGDAAGHCAQDAECLSGTCDPRAGARFGFNYGVGACVQPSCMNGTKDAGEQAIDCGGSCGACPVCPGNEFFNSLELPADSQAVGGPIGGWERVGALTSTENIQWNKSLDASHLDEALAIYGQGTMRSAAFSSSTFATVGSELLFDVKFPIVSSGGAATLKLSLVEANGTKHALTTVLSVANWTTHVASLNSTERDLLNSLTPGLRFEIELVNNSPSYGGIVVLIDHFRVEGTGAALRSECDSEQDPGQDAQKQLVLGFEEAPLWLSSEVTRQAENSDVRQGESALRVEAISHTLRSVPVRLGPEVGPVMQVDVRLPLASSGALQGSLQASLDCPGVSSEVSLGTSNLAHLLAGQWNTLSYVIPGGLWSTFEVAPTQCKIVLAVSVSNAAALSQFIYDHIRFVQQTHCSQFAQSAVAPFAVGMPVTPNGTATYPYPLCNAAQMQTLMDTPALWGKHFVLQADIDLAGVSGMIGTSAQAFTGIFDGQGRTLYGFEQARSDTLSGLFGYVRGDGVLDGQGDAAIQNLTAVNFHITAKEVAGVLVGRCKDCLLTDVGVEASTLKASGSNVGGLLGLNEGTVIRARAAVQVESTATQSDGIGGLIGVNNGTIEDSRASGAVLGAFSHAVGGLVGRHAGPSARILSSSAVGAVSTSGDYIGGLVGRSGAGATIRNSSAHGSVEQSGSGEVCGGLVGLIAATVSNEVTVIGCHATGQVQGAGPGNGGLVGWMEHGNVSDSFALGTVAGAAEYTGGLIGSAKTSSIERSYARGNVSGPVDVGGLMGTASEIEIADVYSWGTVTATSGAAGGLLGTADDVVLKRGYSLSVVNYSDPNTAGALIGQDIGSFSEYSDNFYVTEINPALGSSGLTHVVSGSALDVDEVLATAIFTDADWNFDSIWEMGERGPELQRSVCTFYDHRDDPPFLIGVANPPDGSATNPYVLCSAQQIQWLMNNPYHALTPLRKNYVLGSNIDLTGITGQLGRTNAPFQGTFDGAGRRLSNYTSLLPLDSRIGLFNTVTADAVEDGYQDGLIKDLHVSNFEVEGLSIVGSLVAEMRGRARGIDTSDLHVRGETSVTGGLFGELYLGSVQDIQARGITLECATIRCGGLAGYAQYSEASDIRLTHSTIINSKQNGGYVGGVFGELGGVLEHVDAEVNIDAPSSTHVGGLVGRFVNTKARLLDARVTGAITGAGVVGGLVGSSDADHHVANSAAAVDVQGGYKVGGAIGTLLNGGVVDSCTVSGRVAASTANYVGGFVGYAQSTAAPPNGQVQITNSESWADVNGFGLQGGFVGGAFSNAHIDACAAHGTVTSTSSASETGGFVGRGSAASISNSLATGDVIGGAFSGGFFGGGYSAFEVINSVARGRVSGFPGSGNIGGFGGAAITNTNIYSCHAHGDVSGFGAVGGFLAQSLARVYVENSSAAGKVTCGDQNYAGGFIGLVRGGSTIVGSRAAGNVSSLGNFAGGFVGLGYDVVIENSQATGNVQGSRSQVGGFIGGASHNVFLRDDVAAGDVSNTSGDTGGFGGYLTKSTVERCVAEGRVTGTSYTGSFAGRLVQAFASRSLATGDAAGTIYVGGFAGSLDRSRVSESDAHGDAQGERQTGAFTGHLLKSRAVDVSARGKATTSIDYASGGIVGVSTAGSVVRRAVSMGTAYSATSYSGGIAGISYDLSIRDSYSVGSISAMNWYVGGVVGGHYNSEVRSSFSYSTVAGKDFPKTVAGGNPNSNQSPTRFDSVFGHSTANPPSAHHMGVAGIVDLATEQFTDQATFEGWDFDNVWEMGDLHPVLRKSVCDTHELTDELPFVLGLEQTPDGTSQAPYVLCTADQVQTVMESTPLWDSHFRLGRSISLDGVAGQLGNENTPFRGTFDGFGHALFNYRMLAGNNVHYAALFGRVEGDGTIDGNLDGVIKDLDLIDVQVTGASYVAALVSEIYQGVIQDVRVDRAVVTASSSNAGIIAAVADGASMLIERVATDGILVGQENVGGVVGALVAGAQLKQANSTGSVQSTATGASSTGGLVGRAEAAMISSSRTAAVVSAVAGYAGGAVGSMVNGSSLVRVNSAGTVTLSTGSHVGGLVGAASNGTITDSFSTGAVSGPNAGAFIGLATQVSVQRAYASGAVTGAGDRGAFLGEDGGVLSLSNCFATQHNVALPLSGDGALLSGVTRLTTAEQTTTSVFQGAGWNFTDVWIMATAGPDLRQVIGFIL